jgi:hypothetical protein
MAHALQAAVEVSLGSFRVEMVEVVVAKIW